MLFKRPMMAALLRATFSSSSMGPRNRFFSRTARNHMRSNGPRCFECKQWTATPHPAASTATIMMNAFISRSWTASVNTAVMGTFMDKHPGG
jgi:hypothetical protein